MFSRKSVFGRAILMPMSTEDLTEGFEVRTYFVRERNALVARAEFGARNVDY